MLGNVCMMVGHGAKHGAKFDAKLKMKKILIFLNFSNFPFFQFLTYFSSKMGYFYGFQMG